MKKIILDECGLDALTLAAAYALYEKLVLLGKINKPNRKLVAGKVTIGNSVANTAAKPRNWAIFDPGAVVC